MSAFPSTEHRDRLLALLRAAGITSVRISYAGSGDSGNIEDVECFNAAGSAVATPPVSILWAQKSSVWNSTKMRWEPPSDDNAETAIEDVLRDICDKALEDSGLDWYNNDGGQGHLLMNFPGDEEPEITLEVGINVTNVETYYFNVGVDDLVETQAPKED